VSSGQPYDFFASSLFIKVFHKGMVNLNVPAVGNKPIGQIQIGIMDVFLSEGHMLPVQWFPLVDPKSDLPAEPLGEIARRLCQLQPGASGKSDLECLCCATSMHCFPD
jgi:hypothetical protein